MAPMAKDKGKSWLLSPTKNSRQLIMLRGVASPTQTVVRQIKPIDNWEFAKNYKELDLINPTKISYQFPSMEW